MHTIPASPTNSIKRLSNTLLLVSIVLIITVLCASCGDLHQKTKNDANALLLEFTAMGKQVNRATGNLRDVEKVVKFSQSYLSKAGSSPELFQLRKQTDALDKKITEFDGLRKDFLKTREEFNGVQQQIIENKYGKQEAEDQLNSYQKRFNDLQQKMNKWLEGIRSEISQFNDAVDFAKRENPTLNIDFLVWKDM